MVNLKVSQFTDTGEIVDKSVIPIVNDTGTTPVNARVHAQDVKRYMFQGKGDTGDVAMWDGNGNAVEGPRLPAATAQGRLVDTGTAQNLDGKSFTGVTSFALAAGRYADTGSAQSMTDKTISYKNNTLTAVADTGSFIGQQTIWLPAAAMEPAATTAPATSNVVEIGTSFFPARTMDFASDADDYAYGAIQMPNNWDETSNLVLQFVWSATDTGAIGSAVGVAWSAAAIAHTDSDVLTSAFPTATIIRDNHSGTNDDLAISGEVSVAVGGDTGAEALVLFEFSRDVSDTGDDLPLDARLHGVKIHYQTNAGTDD